jgi:large subunit ribosomal protein L23
MKNRYQIIRRPIITEKGLDKKEGQRTLCFEVDPHANKVEIRAAVEQIFKVKVESVRTSNFEGKERRRGRFSGHKPDWKKAYVKLIEGEKMPEYGENV